MTVARSERLHASARRYPRRGTRLATVGGARRGDRGNAGGGPDPGAQSGEAEHHVHDGRFRKHGLGFPAGLRRLGRPRHRALPRRHPMRRRDLAARRRLHVQPIRSPGAQRELQRRVLRPVGPLPSRQESGRHRPSVRRLRRHVRCAVDRRLRQRLRRLSGRQHAAGPSISRPGTRTRCGAGNRARLRRRSRRPIPTARCAAATAAATPPRRSAGTRRRRSPPATTTRTLRRPASVPRRASSSTSSRSTAIPTTTRSRRSSSARPKTPRAGARRLAPASGIRRRTSTSATAPARRRSIRRPSRVSTSSPRASLSTAPRPPIPAAARTRRRWPTSPTGMRSTGRGSCR